MKQLDDYANRKVQQLVEQFVRIEQERMQGIPIVNQSLEVQAINFQYWQEQIIGILITPWFMNLIILPKPEQDWHQLAIGTRMEHTYPAKNCTFIISELEEFGYYQSHPIHSPMFNFEKQSEAVNVAESFLLNLLDENAEFEEVLDKQAIDQIMLAAAVKHLDDKPALSNINPASVEAKPENNQERPPISERLEKPISRRDLLRGSFLS